MPRRKDIWRCGMLRNTGDAVWPTEVAADDVVWFAEEPEFEFLADPFGMWIDDHLHVFAEHYDYRTRHGTIHKLIYNRNLELLDRQLNLREPWHLSYPQVFEADGAMWMLPEAHRSGALTLYRGNSQGEDWVAECDIALDVNPVDATILQRDGRWWLFYSPATSKLTKIAHLHVAWSDSLTGPWTVHPQNPVRVDARSARPGGAAFVQGNDVILPVQDCSRSYGGDLRLLTITTLTDREFAASVSEALAIPASAGAYREGMHTLNRCGDVTLFDVKRIDRSLRGLALELKRALRAKSR